MRKVVLILVILISLVSNAQGITTVNNSNGDIPVGQWYVIKESKFDNQTFFYDETGSSVSELEKVLVKDSQSFFSPTGFDNDNDPYWYFLKPNGFATLIYLNRGKEGDEYSLVTIITE